MKPFPAPGSATLWLMPIALSIAIFIAGCASRADSYAPRTLDAQTMRVYDDLFFNEIDDPLNRSDRYGEDWKMARKRDFERMAESGYAPAIAFLRLWDFDQRARKSFSQEPFEMLKQRALQGEHSSGCALWAIWSRNNRIGNPDDVREEFRPFVENGAVAGHFACEEQASFVPGGRPDEPMRLTPDSLRLLLSSAGQGYSRAHWVLAHRLQGTAPLSMSIVDQALCWAAVADKSRSSAKSYDLTHRLLSGKLQAAPQSNAEVLAHLRSRWPEFSSRNPPKLPYASIPDCLTLHK